MVHSPAASWCHVLAADMFHRLPLEHVARGLRRLAADLRGCWQERNADLLAEDEHEFGYRLVVADLEEVA